MADPFNLERFVEAQAHVYEQARRELEADKAFFDDLSGDL